MKLNRTITPLTGLVVMLVANLLLCWYPVYYLKQHHSPGDKPDVTFFAGFLAFTILIATLLLVPLAMIKVWLQSHNLTHEKRKKNLTAALLMSLVMLAPICYFLFVAIKLRIEMR
jgi:uncharacterized membrane protein